MRTVLWFCVYNFSYLVNVDWSSNFTYDWNTYNPWQWQTVKLMTVALFNNINVKTGLPVNSYNIRISLWCAYQAYVLCTYLFFSYRLILSRSNILMILLSCIIHVNQLKTHGIFFTFMPRMALLASSWVKMLVTIPHTAAC
jgi:hypothetical protein